MVNPVTVAVWTDVLETENDDNMVDDTETSVPCDTNVVLFIPEDQKELAKVVATLV